MKIYILIGILFHCDSCIMAQQDTLSIKGHRYLVIKQSMKNDFEGKDTLMKLYRLENSTKTYLLAHYLYRYDADCNNTIKETGKMECRHDSLIFESNYSQKGHDPIPKKEKQIYQVDIHGKLKLLSDRIYINGDWMSAENMPGKAP